MKHNVCVVTGSRAEYGLLRALLFRLHNDEEISLQLVVTGSHLSKAFGNTQNEIENDGFNINARIAIPLEGDSKADMAKAAGAALSTFAGYFEKNRPQLLVVLGDRYEIFAACAAATIQGIAIAHISGGDVTEGALDDTFRHCITKMSFLHFPGCKKFAERIVRLGEDPSRVFAVGEPGVENCLSAPFLSISELQADLGFDIIEKPYSIVTFHPVTNENNTGEGQVAELISALENFPDMNFIITKANADAGGRSINEIWDEKANAHANWLLVSSLGVERYISAMKYAVMIIGNSSSGIVEAPAMKKPTINIGDRQKGRMMAESIISCAPIADEITKAINKAMSPEFKAITASVQNPFGDGNTSEKIMRKIKDFLSSDNKDIKKEFYDLEVKL